MAQPVRSSVASVFRYSIQLGLVLAATGGFSWAAEKNGAKVAAAGDSDKGLSTSSELKSDVSSSATSDNDVIAFINEQIRKGWKDAEIMPSPEATENEWCRRLFLDVLGRIPSVSELQGFLADKSKNKKQAVVDRLLDSDEYVEEYARNWMTIWTNILIGRPKNARDEA